jgi:hypothetical protein
VIDINDFPRVIRDNNCWFSAFSQLFGSKGDLDVRGTTSVIADGRKFWAHPGTEDVDSERARTHLSLIADVLDAINEPDAKQTVETIRDQLFSDEVEEHPAEIENAALKEELSEMSDTLAAVEAEKAECEKRLQGVQKRLEELEEIEAAWMDSEERLVSVSNELKTVKSEEEKKKKAPKPRVTFREKFAESTTEEERIELANKVAELRLDPDATRAMAWKQIRKHEDVILSSDEFHKIIRVSDYYEEAMLERLGNLIDEGWTYNGSLNNLCGFDVPEEFVERMEANKAKSKVKRRRRL